MKTNLYLKGCLLLMIPFISCKEDRHILSHYIKPQYQPLTIKLGGDSLSYHLTNATFNNISSFNYFEYNNREYIGFYDKLSMSFNIYDFRSQNLVKRIAIDSCFPYINMAKHTTVYCQNPDSLFVINRLKMFRLDGSLKVKDSVDFDTHTITAFTAFDFGVPPVITGKEMYLPASPFLSQRKRKELKKWRTIYRVDMDSKESDLVFELPQKYIDSLYGLYFLSPSYCFNDKGRFVFSFAADSNIYESDLNNYNIAYSGKSRWQQEGIQAVKYDDIQSEDGPKREFLLRESYGKIFFDRLHNRYIRVAEHKITQKDYDQGIRVKDKSIIIFNEHFQIISEYRIPPELALSTLFFTKNGEMFIRSNYEDENGIHLRKLEYSEETNNVVKNSNK